MQKMYLESTVNRTGPDRPLAANQAWVNSNWLDRFSGEELIRRARAEVKADQAGTLFLEESEDGATANTLDSVPVVAGIAAEIPWKNLTKQFYRLRYVNGAAAQTLRMNLFMESGGRPVVDTQVTGNNLTSAQRLPIYRLDSAGNPVENTEGVLLQSLARTVTTPSPDVVNYNARGVVVFLNVTSGSATGGLQVIIERKDPASGLYSSVNGAPPAVLTIGITSYVLYPGASTAAGGTVQANQGPLGRTWRVRVVHGDATSYTYSLGYSLVV